MLLEMSNSASCGGGELVTEDSPLGPGLPSLRGSGKWVGDKLLRYEAFW